MGRGIDGISAELGAQAEFLKTREPAYERVLRWLDEAVRGELGARLAAAWQGREFNDRERYEQGMREFLRRRPPCTTLRAELEVAPDPQRPLDRPALLTLRFQDHRRALRELQLARCEPHPKQPLTRPEAIREFSSAFADRA